MRRCEHLCRTLGDFLWPLISERTTLVIEAKIFALLPETEFFNKISSELPFPATESIADAEPLIGGNRVQPLSVIQNECVISGHTYHKNHGPYQLSQPLSPKPEYSMYLNLTELPHQDVSCCQHPDRI